MAASQARPTDGSAADLVAGNEELAGGGWEVAAAGIGGQQVNGGGVGEQSPHPYPGVLVRGEQVTGDGGGDGSLTDQVGGFGILVGQGPVGHDQVQFDGGRFGFPVIAARCSTP